VYESGRRGGFGLRVFAVWTAAVALAALQCGCSVGEQELSQTSTSQPSKKAASPAAMEKIRAGVREANLIVIVLDAARADRFGTYGYHRDTTTSIDALFAESIVFEQAYTQAPNTKASVASLFTSQSPTTHGVIGMTVALPPSTPTLVEALSENGFRTVCFSANPFLSSEFGFERGFDEFQEIFREVGLGENELGRVPAELLGRAAIEWLEEHAEERFFAYLHFLEPHDPYTPPEPFASRYQGDTRLTKMMAAYDGNLAYVDSVVGEVLLALERLGLVGNSVVVLMSDHGEAFGEHGRLGHSDTIYEETARIPLAMYLPEACGVAPGRRSGIISTIDLMPTLLDMFGMEPPPTMQGGSELGLLASEGSGQRRYAIGRSRGRDKTGGLKRPEEVVYALIAERHTFMLGNKGKRVELYDRDRDPGQRDNIAEQNEKLVAELLRSFEEWAATQPTRPVVLPGGEVRAAQSPEVEMSDRTRDHLEALGYLK